MTMTAWLAALAGVLVVAAQTRQARHQLSEGQLSEARRDTATMSVRWATEERTGRHRFLPG
ncbi:hypothetical protein HBB16_05280 [Pseudonocardia sp. MCCB 268]|nr:hypothetical protein [Pseudonocardia cytotoxica]